MEVAYKKDICERTLKFGVQIVKLVDQLPRTISGIEIGRQIVRSGTSIGANIEEAQDGLSRKDFIKSIQIALKEARETRYWLRIILRSELLSALQIDSILKECVEINRILTAIVKSTKNR